MIPGTKLERVTVTFTSSEDNAAVTVRVDAACVGGLVLTERESLSEIVFRAQGETTADRLAQSLAPLVSLIADRAERFLT